MSEKNIAQKKIYVLDTNVLIHDPTSILSFSENEVVIPMIVFEELDNLKDRRDKDEASHAARMAIKNIDKIIDGASPTELHNGVKIKVNGGLLIISQDGLQAKTGEDGLLEESRSVDKKQNDNVIINVALKLQKKYKDKKVCLVTKDINMRIKAKSANLVNVEDYKKDQTVDDINLLPKGVEIHNNFMEKVNTISVTQADEFGRNTMIVEPFKEIAPHYNKFIVDRDANAVLRLVSFNEDQWVFEVCTIDVMMKNKSYDLTPKNIHQAAAMQVLNDDEVSCVILLGPAGTGKTLVSIASGIEQSLSGKYEKIIIAKPTPSMTEDIGFLPGTEEEKMLPWLGGVMDSLEYLHKYDHKDEEKKMSNALTASSVNLIIEQANINFKSLNYMRGRSFNDTLLIIDEVQSLTPFQIKSIITRVGLNSKIICLGNLAQIDSAYITELTSGLTHVADKLKNFSGAAILQLEGVERSDLAGFAEETL